MFCFVSADAIEKVYMYFMKTAGRPVGLTKEGGALAFQTYTSIVTPFYHASQYKWR